jgi:phosphoserine phosphatase
MQNPAILRLEQIWSDSSDQEHRQWVVVTDADGTLWRGDVGEMLFRDWMMTPKPNVVRPHLHQALRAICGQHGFDDDGSIEELAIRLVREWQDGSFEELRMCEVMTWATAGMDDRQAREVCENVLDQRNWVATQILAPTIEILKWATARDVPIWVVSASPIVIVQAGVDLVVRAYGLKNIGAIGFELARAADGTHLPQCVGIRSYGPGKKLALERVLKLEQRVLCAMGDSGFDVDMLTMARVPVAIDPKQSLQPHLAAIESVIVLPVHASE